MFLHTERHEFWEHHNYSSLRTRESSKSYPERQEFQEMHSLTSAKMPTNKESIHFSIISHFSHHDSNELINPIQHQPTNHFLGTPSNTSFKLCRPIVIYSDSSTLAQDAILNCYNRPAHNHYQLSYFSETNLILCSILAQIHSGC